MRLRGGAGGAPPWGPPAAAPVAAAAAAVPALAPAPAPVAPAPALAPAAAVVAPAGGRWPRLLPRRPLPPRRLSRLLPRRWRHRFLLSGSAKRALRNCHVCLYENQTSKRFDLEPPSPEDYFKFYKYLCYPPTLLNKKKEKRSTKSFRLALVSDMYTGFDSQCCV